MPFISRRARASSATAPGPHFGESLGDVSLDLLGIHISITGTKLLDGFPAVFSPCFHPSEIL